MNKEQYLIIINEEINIYKEIYLINELLMSHLKKFDFDKFKKELLKKDRLLNKVQNFDKELINLWQNWENLKAEFSEQEKNVIRELRNIMEKNFNLENVIIKEFQQILNKEKDKNLHIQKGKVAFNAYKSKKIVLPYFVNAKG